MRTTKDRIRHTLLFEGIAIVLSTVIAAVILDNTVAEIGALAVALSLVAMGWNYAYNLWFDRWQYPTLPSQRSVKMRVLHAVGFEGGLLTVSLPLVAWWLDMTLWYAFITDVGFALFFMVYAFIFNWVYDHIFPIEAVACEAS